MRLFFLCILSIVGIARVSYASPSIVFHDLKDIKLPTYLLGIPLTTDSQLAFSDLNNDGYDEAILRRCLPSERFCNFKIFAAHRDGALSLGDFSARRVDIDQSNTHGVRSLRIYRDIKNDYKYELLLWNSRNSSYDEAP